MSLRKFTVKYVTKGSRKSPSVMLSLWRSQTDDYGFPFSTVCYFRHLHLPMVDIRRLFGFIIIFSRKKFRLASRH